MVLGELGKKLSTALSKMNSSQVLDNKVFNEMIGEIVTALLQADVNVQLVKKVRDDIKKKVNLEKIPSGVNRRKLIHQVVFDELVALVNPRKKAPKIPEQKSKTGEIKYKPYVIMFVGLQGSGKTTTCAKLAHHYKNKKKKVCLVCADTFRAGAYEQLKQNALKAGVPFYGSYTEQNPVKAAREGVKHFKKQKMEVIIVDTSGRHKQEEGLFEEMQEISEAVNPKNVIFVMDGTIGQSAFDQAKAFQERVTVGSVILTKLDAKGTKGGGAISAVAATGSPIIFYGTGEHLYDLEPFNAKSFISRLLGHGDFGGLFNKIKDAGFEDQAEFYQKMMEKEEVTLRDMYEQWSMIIKMGPIDKVMEMFPGFSKDLLPTGKGEEAQLRIKRFMCMMNSMTNKELDHPRVFHHEPSRFTRIAKGSGHSVKEVKEMFEEYKRFAKVLKSMIKRMKKGGGKGFNMNQLMGGGRRTRGMNMGNLNMGGLNIGQMMKNFNMSPDQMNQLMGKK
ncbi:signal recognition particle 54 kda protein [Anaeramoeba flamelloides]|uniref:Signal recognition particle 54 kDa protein n=1 Tax=Anaeramoeba flamelloides TaxID=1746091 RepID=A0AAV8A418_9EUKA|nr:signal recognition particle 54 kda protein [Anaeramoeba flamelloides]KAJ6236328.1 signal recognition particle 54 kda protein [Anaeramoeba flamelloides]